MSLWVRVSAALCALACSRSPSPAPLGAAASASVASNAPSSGVPSAIGLRALGPSAFALAAAPFGASFVWAEPRDVGSALMTLDLNADGVPERDAWELAVLARDAANVSDLSTVWLGMNRAALWLEHVDREARVQALFKTETGTAERFDFGVGYPASPEARGNVALSAGADEVMAFVRGDKEPCLDATSAPCYGFRFHRFGLHREPTSRVTLSVPVPCESAALELLLAEPRWYYGVCTAQGEQPVVTLFTIQPDPEYAAARELFVGCVPRGALLVGKHPASIAECGGELRIAWLGSGDSEPEIETLSPSAPRCAATPRLAVGREVLELSEPRAQLEWVLPDELAPRGSVAAWTGRALVVARMDAGDLALKRYGCRQGAFVDLGSVPAASPPSPSAGR
jgi:hypothetical protein